MDQYVMTLSVSQISRVGTQRDCELWAKNLWNREVVVIGADGKVHAVGVITGSEMRSLSPPLPW